MFTPGEKRVLHILDSSSSLNVSIITHVLLK